ncbi:PDZ domain-containing protein [Candidatus Nanopelagicales bacterium]|nr:PDZ domain-containing protein [Candidatus Nanopelagicales bacterium]
MSAKSAHSKWAWFALVLVAIVAVAAVVLPVPYVTKSPGPVFDVLGEIDGQPVLEIEGAKSYPTTGMLDITTVAESGGAGGSLNAVSAIFAVFSRSSSVVPVDQQYPDGPPSEQDRERQELVFAASQSEALAAAANFTNRPVQTDAVVFDVVPEGPSEGKLERSDVIKSVNGDTIGQASEVGEVVSKLPVGSEADFAVERDGSPEQIQVTTAEGPDGSSVVGIFVDNRYSSNFEATIGLQDIGGPSAGMIFSLAMVDKLTKEDLLLDEHVAGTGTITAAGDVGPIGGIDKKMIAAQGAGAELFLGPADNCEDILGNEPEGLTVVPVQTLDDSVAAVQDWLANRDLPTCPLENQTSDNS